MTATAKNIKHQIRYDVYISDEYFILIVHCNSLFKQQFFNLYQRK